MRAFVFSLLLSSLIVVNATSNCYKICNDYDGECCTQQLWSVPKPCNTSSGWWAFEPPNQYVPFPQTFPILYGEPSDDTNALFLWRTYTNLSSYDDHIGTTYMTTFAANNTGGATTHITVDPTLLNATVCTDVYGCCTTAETTKGTGSCTLKSSSTTMAVQWNRDTVCVVNALNTNGPFCCSTRVRIDDSRSIALCSSEQSSNIPFTNFIVTTVLCK